MTQLLRQVDGVMEAKLSGSEVVLLGPRSENYVGLDETGAEIWARLRAPMTFEALVRSLAEDYDAAADLIAADIRPMVDDLLSDGLLEQVSSDRR